MQNTRLNTLVDGALGQVNRWLRNPWRRLSAVVISLLLGNLLATTISTIAGQQANLDVLVSLFLVLVVEIISWLTYGLNRRQEQTATARPLLIELLNGGKLGLTYGLFVEAFKLGS